MNHCLKGELGLRGIESSEVERGENKDIERGTCRAFSEECTGSM